jgi:hypothetical protein
MREAVTVQVGGFANYVGSHFWNFQVSRPLSLSLSSPARPPACCSTWCKNLTLLGVFFFLFFLLGSSSPG